MKYMIALFTILSQEAIYAKNLSFSDALKDIEKRSTSILTIKKQVEAADHQYLSSKLNFMPDLSLGYSNNETFKKSSKSDSLYLKTSINLFKGGSDLSNLRASFFNLSAKKSELGQEFLTSESEGSVIMINFIQKSMNYKIFLQFKKIKEKSLNITKERFRKGLTSKQEVLKSKVDLGIARARLRSSKIELSSSRSKLKEVLGHYDIEKSWPFIEKLKSLKLNKISEAYLNQDLRPDLNKVMNQINRESHNLSQIKRSFLPKVDFSYTLSENSFNRFNSSERTSLLTISLPLFSKWKTYSSIKVAQANLFAAKYNYKDKKRIAESEWVSLKENLIENIQTALEREENLALSKELYEDNFKRFQSGRVTVNDLQLDQNRLLESESQSSTGWAQAHLAYLHFCHAQGASIVSCKI